MAKAKTSITTENRSGLAADVAAKGTRFTSIPETGKVPLVADMSSNILSEPYDVSKFGVIFAGAQKNIGPAGFALTIVRRDLIGRAMPITPKVLDYKKLDDAGSMLNTPPTYAI